MANIYAIVYLSFAVVLAACTSDGDGVAYIEVLATCPVDTRLAKIKTIYQNFATLILEVEVAILSIGDRGNLASKLVGLAIANRCLQELGN